MTTMDGMMAERTAPTANRTASWPVTIGMFLLSLPVNALGNALTAVTSDRVASPGAAGSYLGAAYWTAGYYNIASILPDWVGAQGPFNRQTWACFLVGSALIVVDQLLVGRVNAARIAGNLLFLVPFSLLVGMFTDLLLGRYTPGWGGFPYAGDDPAVHVLYMAVNVFGMCCMGAAISLYQRANIALHPADDLMQILRFRFFDGNAVTATWASFAVPTLMIAVATVASSVHDGAFTLRYVGVGTVVAFLFQGAVTGWSDRHLFGWFTHQAVDAGGTTPSAMDERAS